MDRTALALRVEYDEVSVNSIEVLEANIAAVRDSLNEFKNEMREFKNEVRAGFAHIREEIKSIREKSDKSYERLSTKIDATNQDVAELTKTVIRIDSKLNALGWLWGGVGGLAGVFLILSMLNKVFHWY